MKQKIAIILGIAFFIIAIGWLAPWVSSRILVLAGVEISIGLLLSILLSILVFRVSGVNRAQFSKPTRRAINVAVALVGVGFALIVNTFAIKQIARWLYGMADWRVYSYQYGLNTILVEAFMVLLVLGLFYVLLRLYEETLAKRAKRFERQSFVQGGWKLVAKLLLGGVIVFVLTFFISSSDWATHVEYFFDRPGYADREVNDSIGIVFVYSEGKSHDWYFNVVYQLSSELREIGARAALVPLPPRIPPVQSNIKSLQKIAKLGLVVFATPAEEKKAEYPALWVRHPVNNLTEFEWGVVSVQKLLSLTWWNQRFYPNAFKEVGRGYSVPDAAVRLVQNFFGLAKEIPVGSNSKRFEIGKFSMGLHADQSAPVFSTLNLLVTPKATILLDEKKNVLEWYDWGGSNRLSKEEVISRFKGGIVVIDPGETVTSFVQFGFTYSQIIHQIIKGRNVTPLDPWTSYFVASFILTAGALFWFYRPWIAALALIFLTVGQGFLYSWMNSQYGLIIEAVPLFITGALSIPMFVFVRVNHERSFLHVIEKQRALQELQTAHDMQMGLMPKEDPIVPGFDISGICLPANDVGGDFFDYLWLDKKKAKLGIALADVSGKAMKAAMTAVMTSGMIYREAGGNESPKTILRNMNRPLYTKLDSRMFTALSFAVIDTRKKELRFSNAGQSYPLLKRGKEVRSLEVKGARLPLGVKEDVAYGEMAVKLKKGDTLIFYTDGIPEAKDEKDEFYGFERFKSLMENLDGLLAKELRDRILSEVKSFTGNAPQHDDMTVVVVKVT